MDDIRERVRQGGFDRVWTAADFADLASRSTVDKALQRLSADGVLLRIERGLYHRPQMNPLNNKPIRPGIRTVLDAISRRDKTRMLIDGMTAANDLGLTTAVPAKIVVLTDSRRRGINIAGQAIEFRLTAPSRLNWADRPAMRLVQALLWLHDGSGSIDDMSVRRIKRLLADPDTGDRLRQDLRDGMTELPTAWMQDLIRRLLTEFDDKTTDQTPSKGRRSARTTHD